MHTHAVEKLSIKDKLFKVDLPDDLFPLCINPTMLHVVVALFCMPTNA